MYKALLSVFILIFFISNSYAIKTVIIDTNCINISQLLDLPIKENIYCKMNYGDEKKISKQWINNILAKNKIYNIEIKEDFKVKRKGKLLDRHTLIKLLYKKLKNRYPEYNFEISKLNLRNNIYTDNNSNLNIDIINNKFGTVYANVDNGLKTYRLSFYLRAFTKGYVTTQSIKKNDPFISNIEKKDIEITNLRYELIKQPKKYIASKNIPRGKILTRNYVIKKPINFVGDLVTIIYKSGNIKISTYATLEENAYIGKKVKLRNNDSGKVLYAKAISENKYLIIN